MDLIEMWRIRNSNRASIETVLNRLGLYKLREDRLYLAKNIFEIAPYQKTTSFDEYMKGFENRYKPEDLKLMGLVWGYSLQEFKSHSAII